MAAMKDPTRPERLQFLEAPAFSRYREDYLDDEGYRELQQALAGNPEEGDLIPGAGGVRKLRWSDEEIWLLTLYSKDEASDLSRDEKTQLRKALEAERAARKRRETQ
jgi:hypothetical protein